MRVRDLMHSAVVTLHASSTLNVATDIMAMARIRHLPVVDDAGALVGIVSQRDLFRAAISSVLGLAESTQREWLGQVPVHVVMTREVVSVTPDEGIAGAIERMLEGKFGCLPVVEGRRLVGLLTESDCLRSFRDMLKSGRFRGILS